MTILKIPVGRNGLSTHPQDNQECQEDSSDLPHRNHAQPHTSQRDPLRTPSRLDHFARRNCP